MGTPTCMPLFTCAPKDEKDPQKLLNKCKGALTNCMNCAKPKVLKFASCSGGEQVKEATEVMLTEMKDGMGWRFLAFTDRIRHVARVCLNADSCWTRCRTTDRPLALHARTRATITHAYCCALSSGPYSRCTHLQNFPLGLTGARWLWCFLGVEP